MLKDPKSGGIPGGHGKNNKYCAYIYICIFLGCIEEQFMFLTNASF